MPKPLASFLFFDSNVETVPTEYSAMRHLTRLAKRYRKRPKEMLLDRAIHHSILKMMPDSLRRGRPDIVHLSILSIADTPAYQQDLVNFILHTIENLIIVPKGIWRPPRNYLNFVNLFEQLLRARRVPQTGEAVLATRPGDIKDALGLLRGKRVILFSSRGRLVDLRLFFETTPYEGSVYLVGAYAKGKPRKSILEIADDVVSIYPRMLSSQVVVSRVAYELERAISLDMPISLPKSSSSSTNSL
jgi:rRNA small subunit pseudouridine methyltransferase Nep1